MATKPPKQRIDETLQYVQTKIGATQRNEINAALPAAGTPQYNQISQNISLGFHILGNENQRNALRALLLCHQVFIRDATVRDRETKAAKQAHANTPETALQQRIRSWFTLATGNAANVCTLATTNRAMMPMWNNIAIDPTTLVRGSMPMKAFNCYNAVVFWAFQGGAISLRWIWNQWFPATTTALQETALLPGGVNAFPALDGTGEYPVPQANVIVMQRKSNPLGHTVMSIGNGLCISQNNKAMLDSAADGEPTVAKKAHALAAIDDCNHSRCHVISIRFLVQKYYTATPEGYTPMHHAPFWLSYQANQR